MHPTTNKNQKADGLFSNRTTSASTVVWDGTIVTAVPFHKTTLNQLARGDKFATEHLAETRHTRPPVREGQLQTPRLR